MTEALRRALNEALDGEPWDDGYKAEMADSIAQYGDGDTIAYPDEDDQEGWEDMERLFPVASMIEYFGLDPDSI